MKIMKFTYELLKKVHAQQRHLMNREEIVKHGHKEKRCGRDISLPEIELKYDEWCSKVSFKTERYLPHFIISCKLLSIHHVYVDCILCLHVVCCIQPKVE